jgi:uncharacterized protein YbaR (Trm112 family)
MTLVTCPNCNGSVKLTAEGELMAAPKAKFILFGSKPFEWACPLCRKPIPIEEVQRQLQEQENAQKGGGLGCAVLLVIVIVAGFLLSRCK